MRCRKGDMAILVQDPDWSGRDIGAFVNVIALDKTEAASWLCKRVDGKWMRCFWNIGSLAVRGWGREITIPDAWLKPIRPPGRKTATEQEVRREIALIRELLGPAR